jgi:tripartite-type tricarboxylate transporter receptor subunit TctC
MADPDVQKHMTTAAMIPSKSASPEAFKKFLADESVRWKQVVQQVKAASAKNKK